MTILLNFILLAFVIFQMVRVVNRLRGPVEAPSAAEKEEILLLREIRDSLRK